MINLKNYIKALKTTRIRRLIVNDSNYKTKQFLKQITQHLIYIKYCFIGDFYSLLSHRFKDIISLAADGFIISHNCILESITIFQCLYI